jgi:hypothetical protein
LEASAETPWVESLGGARLQAEYTWAGTFLRDLALARVPGDADLFSFDRGGRHR